MSGQQQIDPKKQQGKTPLAFGSAHLLTLPCATELQLQYSNFKNTLQQLAQKIGDIEQEAEEHK